MRPIRLAVCLGLLALPLILSGCIGIGSDQGSQPGTIGDVEIDTTVCANTPGCPPGNTPPSGGNALLIAYRVPDGTHAPSGFSSDNGVSMVLNKSYSDSLTAVLPPPAGEHWVGYRSQNVTPPSWSYHPHFGLPSPGNGQPFHGPFNYRTVVGYMDDTAGGTDPAQCASDPTTTNTAPDGTTTVCIDDPDLATAGTDKSIATRDAAIGSASATVAQGTSGQIPFTGVFAGQSDPSASFQLSATTDAPNGVTVSVPSSTWTPASDSTTSLPVNVQAGPDVATGTYNVTLSAKLSNGQERHATGQIVVALGKPANFAIPVVNGTGAVGQTVTCANGDWTHNVDSYAYQWTRDGTDIPGATSSSYKLVEDDGARLVACRVTASNAAGSSAATSGPIRVAQEGGADVNLNGHVKLHANSDGTYSVDTGISLSCPARLPKNCGASGQLMASSGVVQGARAAREELVAQGGFAAKSGARREVVLKLSHAASKALHAGKRLRLTARITTRNHQLQRVTSQKSFTVKRP